MIHPLLYIFIVLFIHFCQCAVYKPGDAAPPMSVKTLSGATVSVPPSSANGSYTHPFIVQAVNFNSSVQTAQWFSDASLDAFLRQPVRIRLRISDCCCCCCCCFSFLMVFFFKKNSKHLSAHYLIGSADNDPTTALQQVKQLAGRFADRVKELVGYYKFLPCYYSLSKQNGIEKPCAGTRVAQTCSFCRSAAAQSGQVCRSAALTMEQHGAPISCSAGIKR